MELPVILTVDPVAFSVRFVTVVRVHPAQVTVPLVIVSVLTLLLLLLNPPDPVSVVPVRSSVPAVCVTAPQMIVLDVQVNDPAVSVSVPFPAFNATLLWTVP